VDIPGYGSSTRYFPIFDFSALSNYYSSGASLGIAANREMLAPLFATLNGDGANATPPWQQPSAAQSEAVAQRVLSAASLIDFSDPRVANSGVAGNSELSNLFALYVGISKLQDMTNFAVNDRNGASLGFLLDRRFQTGLDEIRDFVSGISFEQETLLFGVKQSTTSGTVMFEAANAIGGGDYIGAVTSEARDDPIPNLIGNETFTITIDSDIVGSKVVNVDLAGVSGPLTEDNIVDYLNTELENAGVATRFATERFSEFSYGLRIEAGSDEKITFADASNAETSVYLAGHTKAGDSSRVFMTEFDNLDEAEPGSIFRDVLDGEGVERANASAVDSDGNLYIVGTTSDDMGAGVLQNDTDTYLRKYDAAGQLVWSRLMGTQETTTGLAVTVDGDDNVIIAGQTNDNLNGISIVGGGDSFVTKYNPDGVEQWTYQAPRAAIDGAAALTADAAGNVFVAGYTYGAIGSDTSHGGGKDGYVTKLNENGTVDYSKQFGGAGDEKAIDIQVDGAGNFYVLGEADGQAVLRKYADDDISQTPVWTVSLGDLGTDGAVTGLAVGSNGALYVSGYSNGTALNGAVAQNHSGERDGFVQRIDDAGGSASVNFVSYLGTIGADAINDIAVDSSAANDRIFLAGDTSGNLSGGDAPAIQAAFLAEMNNAGGLVDSRQVGTTIAHQGATVAIDSDGKSVLTKLGLPSGTILNEPTSVITAQSTVRAGQYFELSVNGTLSERIIVEDDDSLGFLAFKINKVLGTAGRASVEGSGTERYLKFEADDGQLIQLTAGAEGKDALVGLGLREIILTGDTPGLEDQSKSPIFSLGLIGDFDVSTFDGAQNADVLLSNALREIRDMFKFMATGGDAPDPLPALSEADSKRIAEMQNALLAMQVVAQNAQIGARALFDMRA